MTSTRRTELRASFAFRHVHDVAGEQNVWITAPRTQCGVPGMVPDLLPTREAVPGRNRAEMLALAYAMFHGFLGSVMPWARPGQRPSSWRTRLRMDGRGHDFPYGVPSFRFLNM